MSKETILGLLFGFGLFVGSIVMSTKDIWIFASLPSFIMVFGGTVASTFISFRARYVWLAMAGIAKIFKAPRVGREYLSEEVAQMIEWGYLVRKEGLISLEKEIVEIEPNDLFLLQSIDLVVTGYTADEIRTMCTEMTEAEFERNSVDCNVLRYMGSAAPAFGMIGTLVGLVIMLNSLADGDAGTIGTGMAVALITTLYGVLFARLLFLPAANKLQQNLEILRFRNFLMTEGFVMLAQERSPRFIQDWMNCYLDPAIQYRGGSEGSGS